MGGSGGGGGLVQKDPRSLLLLFHLFVLLTRNGRRKYNVSLLSLSLRKILRSGVDVSVLVVVGTMELVCFFVGGGWVERSV